MNVKFLFATLISTGILIAVRKLVAPFMENHRFQKGRDFEQEYFEKLARQESEKEFAAPKKH